MRGSEDLGWTASLNRTKIERLSPQSKVAAPVPEVSHCHDPVLAEIVVSQGSNRDVHPLQVQNRVPG